MICLLGGGFLEMGHGLLTPDVIFFVKKQTLCCQEGQILYNSSILYFLSF